MPEIPVRPKKKLSRSFALSYHWNFKVRSGEACQGTVYQVLGV